MSNEIDKKLFEQIFSHILEKLANKLKTTTNKEQNQIIVENIDQNRNKFYEQQKGEYVIQTNDQLIDLIDAIDLILDFNKNENENVNENEIENINKNDETLMSSNEDETMSQNEIKKLNDHFDKMIDKSKSFEDQIKSFKKVENLDEYYSINYFDYKELKSKIFKLKLAHLTKSYLNKYLVIHLKR